jgi:hypothetical protein
MRKMFFLVLAAAALLLMVPAQDAQAQSETPRVEFGVHYSRLSLHDFDATDHGVGTRLTRAFSPSFPPCSLWSPRFFCSTQDGVN